MTAGRKTRRRGIRTPSSLRTRRLFSGSAPRRYTGGRVGLEAMLVPPRRPRFPPDTPADIAAITSWLAGVYRPSFGFHIWTVYKT